MLHLPLSSARRLVRILGSVIEPLVLAMLNGGHELSLRRAVAGELIGDHDPGWPHLPLQQLAQQPLGCLLVPSALHEDVEHHAGLIHRPPQPVLHTGDLKHDLIEMPFVVRPRQATTDMTGELLAKFACPLPCGFVTDDCRARPATPPPCGKRKYSHTACPMISAGNRYPA